MIRVDLHCHSKFSAHPSEWFLQRIGASESYTEVESLYRQAKARGMTHVTITDHNTIEGALELVERHPEDTFISVETTAYFPEDGCKVHVLVYDIQPSQFEIIQEARHDIYRLRDYLKRERIAASLAHATYSVNGRLSRTTFEKLLLLFDVFEGMNGARGRLHNQTVQRALDALTPDFMRRLTQRHGIEPWGAESWNKGKTAGSDDHAGLFVGRTYTESAACGNVAEFLGALKGKKTSVGGSQGCHKSLAFAIYKIARDFSKEKTDSGDRGFMSFISGLLFDNPRGGGLREWWAIKKLKRAADPRTLALGRFCEEVAAYQGEDPENSHARIDAIYDSLGRLTDEFFVMILSSLEKDLKSGQTDRVIKNLSAALPALFMIAPFFTSMHHLHSRNRDVLRAIDDSLGIRKRCPARVLWFSDTVTDLNGVAVTMRELAKTAARSGHPVKIVTSLPGVEAAALPPNTLNLPCIYSFTPEFYSAYTLRVPSILSTLDRVAAESPDEIVISTPGPVGLLGLAAARVMGIPCTGVYHTDFTKQADHFIGDEWVSSAVETYTKWFFRQMEHVRVPSQQYIKILSGRGLDPARMSVFRRGVEPAFAAGNPDRQKILCERFGIPRRTDMLMWAGRLGKEKNLDFLLQVCRETMSRRPDTALLMVGDGPEFDLLKSETAGDERIVFTGRVDRADLAQLYLMSDVFVFPSTTDTFGMVILECHACGLPAIVSDIGGPQEIVCSGETGFVVKANDKKAWVAAIVGMLDLKHGDPEIFARMRQKAREASCGDYGWERVLDEMTGVAPPSEAPAGMPSGNDSVRVSAVTHDAAAG